MAEKEGKYNIKAASKMLGIQPGTLRAWERRYQMIAPIRNESGHRLYTEEHINILKWLNKKVNQGFTISQAVTLMDNKQSKMYSESFTLKQGTEITSLSEELLDSFVNFNEVKAQEIMNTIFSIYTIDKVMTDIFQPLLIKIGDLREAGKITSAHDHFASSLMRTRIGTIISSLPNCTQRSKAIAVCCPGEWHEIGLLIFTFFLRQRGIEVVYLGANIVEEDVFEVIKLTQPDFLFLSCTMQENLTRALTLVTQLSLMNKDLFIGLGGQAVNSMDPLEIESFSTFIVGQTPNDLEDWLMGRMRMM